MTATMVMVHGTGVRGVSWTAQLDAARDEARRRGLVVRPCVWGDDFGASIGDGRSVPEYDGADRDPTAAALEEQQRAWAVLTLDPLHELRVLGVRSAGGAPSQQEMSRLRRDVEACADDPGLLGLAADAGIADHWDRAVTTVLRSSELRAALVGADEGAIVERRAVARACVAGAEAAARDDGIDLDPRDRERLVDAMVVALGADVAGRAADALATVATILVGATALGVAPLATWAAVRRRSAVADGTAPMAGDILRYQVRGDGVRDLIAATARAVDGEVVLVGHSLGGVACVDLLATTPIDNVVGLVTVGSQAPFFHEIGALWSLEPGAPLPDPFPPWRNIYDRKDVLSFVGAGVFPDRVDDVEVDNRRSFPFSHTSYYSNRAVWDAIEEFVRR